jgi:hypothetical protein
MNPQIITVRYGYKSNWFYPVSVMLCGFIYFRKIIRLSENRFRSVNHYAAADFSISVSAEAHLSQTVG